MSQPNVTITLGRTGQVVRRRGSALQNPRGGKQSIGKRDRSDHPPAANKRLRGDDLKRNSDPPIARSDLRLKLMRQRRVREHQIRNRRENLSKPVHLPAKVDMPRDEPARNKASFLRQNPSRPISETSYSQDLITPPLRSFNEMQRGTGRSPAGISGALPFVSREIVSGVNSSRQMAPTIMKPMAPIGGIMPQSSHMAAETLTVAGLLNSLGLGKYTVLFQVEEVDMVALKRMSDTDLKQLGIPMGPRKKILLALQPRRKWQSLLSSRTVAQ